MLEQFAADVVATLCICSAVIGGSAGWLAALGMVNRAHAREMKQVMRKIKQ